MGQMTVEGITIDIDGDVPSPEEAARAVKAVKRVRELNLIKRAEESGVEGGGDAPIPDVAVPTLREGGRTSPSEIFDRAVRDPAIAGMGAAGAEAGLKAGARFGPTGALVGALGGGALGAGLGAAGSATARNALSLLFPQEFDFKTATDISEQAAREMGLDIAFSAGGQSGLKILSLAPGVSRFGVKITSEAGEALFGKIFGLRTPEAEAARRLGEQGNIPLGGVNVSKSRFAKGFPQVIGVFPIVGTAFRTTRKDQDAKLMAELTETLESFSPYEVVASQVGVDAVTAARSLSGDFRLIEGTLWDGFRTLAKGAPAFVPTKNTRALATELAEEAKAGTITLEDGTTVNLPDPIRDFVTDLAKLPEHITPEQFDKLRRDFKTRMDTAGRDGFSFARAGDLKLALKTDFLESDFALIPDSNKAVAVRNAFEAANEFTAKGILNATERFKGGRSRFQGPAAQALKSVDPNLFDKGQFKLTRRTTDEAVNLIVNAGSAALVDDFAKLVGDDVMKEAAGVFFRDAQSNAFKRVQSGIEKIEIFDPRKFGEQLGIFGTGTKNEARTRLLQKAGVDVPQLRATLETASKFIDPRDPATMVARRTVLGGGAAVIGSFLLGQSVTGGAGGGLVGTAALTLLLRKTSKMLADPKALKNIQTALKRDVAIDVRRASMIRALRVAVEGDPEFRNEINQSLRDRQE